MSLKSELETIRDNIIKESNTRFHEEMKLIIAEEMTHIDFDTIAEQFRTVVKENPIKKSFNHTIDIKLDKLITKRYSLDENNRPVENTKEPLKVYYNYKGINYYYVSDGSTEVYLYKMFETYLEEVDPEIQSMLVSIKKMFNDASVSCKAYLSTHSSKCGLIIMIKYDLNPVNL